jgi:hypothetical protein
MAPTTPQSVLLSLGADSGVFEGFADDNAAAAVVYVLSAVTNFDETLGPVVT